MRNAESLEQAQVLREEGKLREAYEAFCGIAERTANPIHRVEILLIAIRLLTELGEIDKARGKLDLVKELLSFPKSQTPTMVEQDRLSRIMIGAELCEIAVSENEETRRETLASYEHFLNKYEADLRRPNFRDLYETARMESAFLLADLGSFSEALPILEEVEQSDPKNPVLLFYLGYCCISAEKHLKADRTLQEAIKVGLPARLQFRAYCALGMAHYELGDYKNAKIELERGARTADPRYIKEAQIWKWLEYTCISLGLKEEADYYANLSRPS